MFPFFELPVDIRARILRLLLQPLYSASPKGGDTLIRIILYKNYEPSRTFAESDLEAHWDNQCRVWPHLLRLSSEDLAMEKVLFERNSLIVHHRELQHPDRKGHYNIQCSAFREYGQPGTYRGIGDMDYIYLEWLRNAWNVSTRFREELCSIFWSRVGLHRVSLDGSDNGRDTSLLAILEARPAIHKGIKYLHLQWDAEYGGDLGNGFEEWCKSISKTLELETLELEVKVNQGDLQQLCSTHGKFKSSMLSDIFEYRKIWSSIYRFTKMTQAFNSQMVMMKDGILTWIM